MHLRKDFRGWRFYLAITHSAQVEGVNSKLPDGRHFLMWDFDNEELHDVRLSLLLAQDLYRLPTVYVVNTGIPNHYHAYCFKAFAWPDVLRILASTQGVDPMYFKIGVIRGYFTLRISPKKQREFHASEILTSRIKADVNPLELGSFIAYWTKRI